MLGERKRGERQRQDRRKQEENDGYDNEVPWKLYSVCELRLDKEHDEEEKGEEGKYNEKNMETLLRLWV